MPSSARAQVWKLSLPGCVWVRVRISPWRRSKGYFKRIFTPAVGAFASVLVFGYAVGSVGAPIRTSFSDGISLLLFLAISVAWLAWWRFQRDIDTAAEDAERRPSLPIASGAVALHDAAHAARTFLFLALGTAVLLGWPVFIGMASATLAVRLSSRQGHGWGTAFIADVLLRTATAASLGATGLFFGLRQVIPSANVLHLVAGYSVFVGVAALLVHLRDQTDLRVGAALMGIVIPVVCLLVLRSSTIFWLVAAYAAGTIWVARKPSSWQRSAAVPIYLLMTGFAFFALFFPHLLGLATV